jgi:hypothetical protein
MSDDEMENLKRRSDELGERLAEARHEIPPERPVEGRRWTVIGELRKLPELISRLLGA